MRRRPQQSVAEHVVKWAQRLPGSSSRVVLFNAHSDKLARRFRRAGTAAVSILESSQEYADRQKVRARAAGLSTHEPRAVGLQEALKDEPHVHVYNANIEANFLPTTPSLQAEPAFLQRIMAPTHKEDDSRRLSGATTPPHIVRERTYNSKPLMLS